MRYGVEVAGVEPADKAMENPRQDALLLAIALISLGFVIPPCPTQLPLVPPPTPLEGHTGGTNGPARFSNSRTRATSVRSPCLSGLTRSPWGSGSSVYPGGVWLGRKRARSRKRRIRLRAAACTPSRRPSTRPDSGGVRAGSLARAREFVLLCPNCWKATVGSKLDRCIPLRQAPRPTERAARRSAAFWSPSRKTESS